MAPETTSSTALSTDAVAPVVPSSEAVPPVRQSDDGHMVLELKVLNLTGTIESQAATDLRLNQSQDVINDLVILF